MRVKGLICVGWLSNGQDIGLTSHLDRTSLRSNANTFPRGKKIKQENFKINITMEKS